VLLKTFLSFSFDSRYLLLDARYCSQTSAGWYKVDGVSVAVCMVYTFDIRDCWYFVVWFVVCLLYC